MSSFGPAPVLTEVKWLKVKTTHTSHLPSSYLVNILYKWQYEFHVEFCCKRIILQDAVQFLYSNKCSLTDLNYGVCVCMWILLY